MFSTRTQKHILNTMLIVAFLFICILILIGLRQIWIMDYKEEVIKLMSVRIAISIILIWFMIFIPYLAWAVYFYNINLGKTNEEWEAISRKNQQAESEEEKIIPSNPYEGETFGLPKGTIRGSLAITLMVGGLSLFVVAIGHPTILRDNEFFHENFEFFKTAFLMMIAFYFGTKGLEYLQGRAASDDEERKKEIESESESESKSTKNETTTDGAPNGLGGGVIGPLGNSTMPTQISDLKKKILESFDADDDDGPPVAANGSTAQFLLSNIPVIPKVDEAEKQKTISEEDIREAADRLKVDMAAVQAVLAVESRGKGFLPDGRPIILFEGHVFWKQLDDKKDLRTKHAVEHPDIVYETWTKKFYKGGSAEYERFKIASLIDDQAAKKSTSWGLFQIMGFNHAACGFATVDEFVSKMSLTEGEQLNAFMNFCEHNNLTVHLRKKEWGSFALKYNGKGYKENQYDYKLEKRYNEFARDYSKDLVAELTREKENIKQTEGTLKVYDTSKKDNNGKVIAEEIFTCKTLELPWKNNQRNVSCIPEGPYTVEKRWTQERQNHFHVLNVPDRSFILIHSGNYYSHTLGCILPGQDLTDINNDGFKDVTQSKATLTKLNEILPKSFELTIKKLV